MDHQKHDSNLKVGIIIPTMNRSEFVMRQLNYYTSVNSPHSIYIGDASDNEHAQKLQKEVEKRKEFLKVNYWHYPKSDISPTKSMTECLRGLFSKVEEKYTTFAGDDDYQIPNSLSKCAEFLKNNPDYSSASGYAVSFRLINNGVYGELNRLADYPRRQIELPTASDRLLALMSNYRPSLFSVHRTEQMRRCWSQAMNLKNWEFSTEILPSTISLILGKSKILDCLGFVRQIHNVQHKSPDTFDWITHKDWQSSFEIFCDVLSKEIAEQDRTNPDKAKEIVEQSLWIYLNMYLSIDYNSRYGTPSSHNSKQLREDLFKKIKLSIGHNFPWLKNIYHQILRPGSASQRLHYEVLQPDSKYYKDFKPVMDSFTGKNRID